MTFSADNLEVSITLNGKTVTWKPTPAVNTTLNGNLLGTIRVSYFLWYLCICMHAWDLKLSVCYKKVQ